MPDGKALQCGTSHQLGQGFAKAFGINFLGRDGKKHTPWQNSWGLSTRLIGGLVMAHSDNNGLVLPPKVAKNKLVIIPIIFEKTKEKVNNKAEEIKKALVKFNPILDDREDYSPGWKYNEWELKGIPLRVEIGPKDLEKNQVVVVRRDNHKKENIKITNLNKKIPELLDDIQNNLFQKAKKFLNDNIIEIKNLDEFKKGIKNRKIVKTVWCNNIECEEDIKDKTGVSTRCIPFDSKEVKGKCPNCKKPAKVLIYFSKSY